jgi:hypothetical protein
VSFATGEDAKPRAASQVALDLGTSADPALLYVGPKDHHALAAAGHDLRLVCRSGTGSAPSSWPS